jgi:hypothetical protein
LNLCGFLRYDTYGPLAYQFVKNGKDVKIKALKSSQVTSRLFTFLYAEILPTIPKTLSVFREKEV